MNPTTTPTGTPFRVNTPPVQTTPGWLPNERHVQGRAGAIATSLIELT